MSQSVDLRGLTGTQAEVNAANEVKVSLTQLEDEAGFVNLACMMADPSDPGGGYVERLQASDAGRLATGTDQTMHNEGFPGAAFNSKIWSSTVSTMTATVASNFANLNAASSLASGAVAMVRTYAHFPFYKSFPTILQMDVQFSSLPVANNVCEWGAFLATGTAAPTDGVFFRVNAAGEFRCVISIGGTETLSPAIDFATWFGNNITRNCKITVNDQEVDFYVDTKHMAGVERPAAIARITGSNNLPFCFRNYNSSATSTAQIMKIGDTNVSFGDMQTNKLWTHVMARSGGNAAQAQTGSTVGQTAQFANSASPAAAVPTNTTAALATGFGGIFIETDTVAIGTDCIIDSYQVPAGTAAVPGKTMHVTGLRIESHVSTVIVGGGYVAFWGIAFGHTAVSLATADAATTKAPVRIGPFGQHTVGAAAAALTQITSTGAPIQLALDVPIVVNAGEFFQVIRRKQSGTTSTSGAITHIITPIGYME